MARYYKSHSNYVLKTKHQNVSDGTIFERDAVTIGGLDQFAKGQRPIFRSSNFIITINKDNESNREIINNKWEENENGEYWTFGDVSETKGNTYEIVLNKDYAKLKDFAYYGSCSELIRASLTDIIRKFPGELYAPFRIGSDSEGLYTYRNDKRVEMTVMDKHQIFHTYKYLVDNPFNIDIHSRYVNREEMDNPLRYFSDEGYKEYEICDKDGEYWEEVEYLSFTTYGFEQVSSITPTTKSYKTVSGETKKIPFQVKRNGTFYDFVYNNKDIQLSVVNLQKALDDLACTMPYSIIVNSANNELTIGCFTSDGYGLTYLVGSEDLGKRIRPKAKHYDEFYKNLDTFEKVLMDKSTSPKYTARFEILRETPYGYATMLEDFTFPTTYGDYNIDATSSVYQEYLEKLSEIGSYYDEYFCDNLYRNYTHEAIKNFDWSFTREYREGAEEEYIEGGTKIQNLIRLFGREFDEIRQYAEGIKDYNSITYYNSNSIPNYFLTDVLNIEGWDIVNIYPRIMNEYVVDEDGKQVSVTEDFDDGDSYINRKSGKIITGVRFIGYPYNRTFDYDLTSVIKPFSKEKSYWCYDKFSDSGYYGYFLDRDGSQWLGKFAMISFENNGTFNKNIEANYTDYSPTINNSFTRNLPAWKIDKAKTLTFDDRSKPTFLTTDGKCYRDKIVEYTSEKEYTMDDVNNHFMKMLKLNSKSILRKKGTINGIEEILSLFGLKSRKWVESLNPYQKNGRYKDCTYDYDISEHIMFTNGIVDKYDKSKDMHSIDWYNYTKDIPYATEAFANGIYKPYQGLPVTYYELEDGNRVIYPYFDNKKYYDGGMYYQMDGGWLSKFPFTFDRDNRIVLRDEDKCKRDLHTQTLRNVQSVETLRDLVELPQSILNTSVIYNVKDLSGEYLIIGGELFNVYTETNDKGTFKYIILKVMDGSIMLNEFEFNGVVRVTNPCGVEFTYKDYSDAEEYDNIEDLYLNGNGEEVTTTVNVCDLSEYADGEEIMCYIINDKIYIGDENDTEIKNYSYFRNEKQDLIEDKEATSYFILNNVDNSRELSSLGWRQLTVDDYDYKLLNTIVDYFEGNNPHSAVEPYDNGFNYVAHFTELFKFADDNDYWDERCYLDENTKQVDGVFYKRKRIGFNGLCDRYQDENWVYDTSFTYSKEYNTFGGDSKVHFFGNTFDMSGVRTEYDESTSESLTKDEFYANVLENFTSSVTFDDSSKYEAAEPNGCTDQIMNTKIVEITFNINGSHLDGTSCEGDEDCEYMSHNIEKVRYYDEVIMNYVSQMLPANAIVKVYYKF